MRRISSKHKLSGTTGPFMRANAAAALSIVYLL